MNLNSQLLTTATAKSGGRLRRCITIVTPFVMLGMVFVLGIFPAILQQLAILGSKPWKFFSPWAWRDAILGASLPGVLDWSDKAWAPVKEVLLREARGNVLEVGAGSGATVKYYDEKRITSLTLLEPFDALHESLRASVVKAGLKSKATILSIGIEKRSEAEAKGVKPGTYDTIVLVQVLCSIPNPKSHLEYLQSLLKPGGRLLLFEHVRSTSLPTRIYQTLWTYPVWKFCTAGCCFDRDSATWLEDIGGWSSVSITRPVSEDAADFVPHAVTVYVKAKA